MDTEDYGQYRGFRIDASGVAFEVFVTEILSRDPEIELVSARSEERRVGKECW